MTKLIVTAFFVFVVAYSLSAIGSVRVLHLAAESSITNEVNKLQNSQR